MREIEFRAKRKDNGEWVYGSLIRSDEFYGEIRETPKYYICPFETTFEYDECSDDSDEVITETIGQYVGLKDKNGTKIFEGDILKQAPYMCDENPCVVCYDTEVGSGIGFYLYTYCDRQVLSDEWEDFEVIGNIYDNPELLEATND